MKIFNSDKYITCVVDNRVTVCDAITSIVVFEIDDDDMDLMSMNDIVVTDDAVTIATYWNVYYIDRKKNNALRKYVFDTDVTIVLSSDNSNFAICRDVPHITIMSYVDGVVASISPPEGTTVHRLDSHTIWLSRNNTLYFRAIK